MKFILLHLLAFMGGDSLAIQAGYNTQLGTLLKQPVLAVIATSVASAILAAGFVLITGKEMPNATDIQQISWYLWFIGGLFSVLGISLYFYTIPQLGISKMIAIGLCGQLLFSLIAGQFGWLTSPLNPLLQVK